MKQVASLFILCFLAFNALAQEGDKRKEKKEALRAKKIAYITQALELTPTVAEKFWPLYNQKNEEERQAKKALKPNLKKGDLDNMSVSEIEKELLNGLKLQERLLEIERKYFEAFKRIISVKDIAKLHRAEKRFKVTMVEQFKQRERPRNNHPRENRF